MRLRTVRLLVVLMAGVLLGDWALAQPGPVEAAPKPEQNYEELPVEALKKNDANKVSSILMAGKFANGDQALFDSFYQDYFLSRWTKVKTIASLPAWRKELRISHLGKKAANPNVHDHLNTLVLEFMKNLAVGPYHPAVQVNAMLMIGELNGVEMPPTPLPEALNVMMAAAGNAKLSDAVRVAALVGIQRHIAAGISDQEVVRSLTSALLKLEAADLPAGAAAAGREWILALATETLGRLGSVGENNAVFKMMAKTLSDVKLSLSTRSIAAESLGRLNYAGAAGINPVEAAAMLGQFVIDACTEELRRGKDAGLPISRRRMKQSLSAAMLALIGGEENRKGIAPLAREPGQRAFLAELQKNIETLMKVLDKASEGDDLEGPVDQLRSTLEAWLKKKPK